jgi:hypothetical protein
MPSRASASTTAKPIQTHRQSGRPRARVDDVGREDEAYADAGADCGKTVADVAEAAHKFGEDHGEFPPAYSA